MNLTTVCQSHYCSSHKNKADTVSLAEHCGRLLLEGWDFVFVRGPGQVCWFCPTHAIQATAAKLQAIGGSDHE